MAKTIIDTASGGAWLVRMTPPGQDNTIGTETWTVTNGSFYANVTCIYNSNLTHDTSWSDNSYGVYAVSIQLSRVTLFGSNTPCQIHSVHDAMPTFYDITTERRVALGIGWYYDRFDGWGGEEGRSTDTYQLIGVMLNGVLYGDSILASVEGTSSNMARSFELCQNYPNPFNPTTKIQFTIVNRLWTIVNVYDLVGREVATLVNEVKEPGTYTVQFDGSNLASGVYLYRLTAGTYVQTRKLVLIR
jgi:hypothetical protein